MICSEELAKLGLYGNICKNIAQLFSNNGVMLLAGRAVGGSNCEALPDMSLFHNLKLKRRKVDSRGSSDGESLAEMTNLSSEGSELREGVQLPGDPADFSQARDHERESMTTEALFHLKQER